MKTHLLALILSLFLLSGCSDLPLVGGGSSGGGDDPGDFSIPLAALKGANATLEVAPGTVAVGDRIQVRVRLTEIHPDGVLVKFRTPRPVRFIEDSALLQVEEYIFNTAPFVNHLGPNNYYYLVFFFPRESFTKRNEGVLSFQFRAFNTVARAKIELDMDVHDPTKDPSEEFNYTRPLFSAETERVIEVRK